LGWDVALAAFGALASPARPCLLDDPRLAVGGSRSASRSPRALLGSAIRAFGGVMDRSDVGGQLAHPREQHVVLLVDVLVQIEFERGERLEQRAVRPA
jgi:hypothetical protein